MPKPVVGPRRRTNPLIWCIAIICTLLTVAVIITGIAVFIGYIVIRPKVPQIIVTSAQLDRVDYDQAGILTVRVIIFMEAKNENEKAHSSFYDTDFALGFEGIKIAYLRSAPIDVKKNSSIVLRFDAESTPITLEPKEQDIIAAALSQNYISFYLKGTTRTRWRVGLLGSVKFWLHLDCPLRLPRNGDLIDPKCSTKSK